MPLRVYVGNIPEDITEEEIWDLFSQVGDVQDVTIIIDRDTGEGKGFAFVEMKTNEQAENSIRKFNGYKIDNRKLVVNVAKPRVDKREKHQRHTEFRP